MAVDRIRIHDPHAEIGASLCPRHPVEAAPRIRTGVLGEVVAYRRGRVRLDHEDMAAEIVGLSRRSSPQDYPMRMTGMREPRSENSWLHNSPLLMRGNRIHRALMHLDDAAARQIAEGDEVTVRSPYGHIALPVSLTAAHGCAATHANWMLRYRAEVVDRDLRATSKAPLRISSTEIDPRSRRWRRCAIGQLAASNVTGMAVGERNGWPQMWGLSSVMSLMSVSRVSKLSSATRVSIRARWSPMQVCSPAAKDRCGVRFRKISNCSDRSHRRSSRLAEPMQTSTTAPAGRATPSTSVSSIAYR